MTGKALHEKGEKYFFSENIFDDGYTDAPPPPSFSEHELADAKQKSTAEGRQQGLKEAEGSQLRITAQILDQLRKQLAELSAAEAQREKIFEQETLALCLSIFERMFPVYNKAAGFEELKQAISEIIKKQEGQNHVAVTVTPDMVAPIETHLNSLKESGLDLKFAVKGDETLAPGACRLAWSEGGALRNPQMLADEIRTSIEQVLAKKGLKGHDKSETGSSRAGEGA
ncbi:MAG: FliH/SctL family protein [Alphaproteobacteria bacterium]